MFMSTFTLTLLCYNQEADHLANLGADGIKKVTVAKKKRGSDERSKTVRGFWDGGKKGMVPVGVEL